MLTAARRYLICPTCAASTNWQQADSFLVCPVCGQGLAVINGVVHLGDGYCNEVIDFYDFTGGPRFVSTEFADDVRIHCTTRRYRQCLDDWVSARKGALLDLGCGDGRLSLWALEAGFEHVVALDSTSASLERLSHEASRRGFSELLAVCGAMQSQPFVAGSFDCVLLFEVIGYFAKAERAKVLAGVSRLLAQDASFVLCEFTRHGRMLADVVALNLENMRLTAFEGRRLEKDGLRFSEKSIETFYLEPDELIQEAVTAGFQLLEKKGTSPIPMLFQHAYNFTSYPLRPQLDAEVQRLIEALDDQTDEACSLSRNVVLLLKKAFEA